MRYFLELAYFGKAYHGWQKQPNAVTVQEVVENCLSILLRKPIEITGAGRTDTGVHAKQIFAHFDWEMPVEENFIFRMNSLLPNDISVVGIYEVQQEAHARFDAIGRSYEYHLTWNKNVFLIDRAHQLQKKPDIEKMNRAAGVLCDYHNFKCFSRSRTDVKTFNCDIREAFWLENEEGMVFKITADRFLRNMVRAIVGTLLEIGEGKMEVETVHAIIESGDRGRAGASVPAKGLFLTEVKYPKSIFV